MVTASALRLRLQLPCAPAGGGDASTRRTRSVPCCLQADAYGAASQGPIQGAALAGMISVEWVELKPPVLTPADRAAYIAALKAKLPRGAQVAFTTHLDDPEWAGSAAGPCCSRDTRGCNSDSYFHRKAGYRSLLESVTAGVRSLLDAGNGTATAAAAAASNATASAASAEHYTTGSGGGSGGGSRPSYRPVPGRLVTNTLITGVADRQRLAGLLLQIQRNPAAVFSPWLFGRMHAEPSAGVRLVPSSTFVSPCERPSMTTAQPFGPTAALVEAAPAPGLACSQASLLGRLRLHCCAGAEGLHRGCQLPGGPAWRLTAPCLPPLPLPPALQWVFAAQPAAGSARNLTVAAPSARFFGLTASTWYAMSVACLTPAGQRVPGLSALTITTPSAG